MQNTAEQSAIIAHQASHARIIAVAGSGKTHTLTGYVRERLNAGLSPRRLLVLMYNKAAQLDFERRLRQLMPQQTLPDIRTFHSLGYRICQTLVRQGDMPVFSKDLLSDAEIETTVWRILRSLASEDIAEDILSRKKKWVEPAVSYIELVKSSLKSPDEVFESTGLPEQCDIFIEAFHQFEQWRADQGRLSFSDLIYDPVRQFIAKPHLQQQFGGHLAEIVIDEFQDINPVQQALINTLKGEVAQLMVVGDPDQTIYEFRGSTPSLLTHQFAKQHSPMQDYQLSYTFRYGDRLSLLANQIIAGNYQADTERTFCVSHPSTADTQVKRLPVDDHAQAALATIQHWLKQRSAADIAVINRLWANSARLELLLLANAVPYRLDNQQTVLERFELRPFRLLLQLATGAQADWNTKTRRLAWQTLLTQPYLKIKKAIVDQLIQELSGVRMHWGQALRNAVPSHLSTYQSDALFERARWIERAERGQGDAYPVIHGWLQATDYLAALKDNAFSAAQVEDQAATVKAFADFVRQSKWRLADGAQQLAQLIARKTPSDQPAVLVTSIHKSKGREWPCVLVPEVNNRYYPYQPEGEMVMASSIASERRLLYVAVTRAIEELVILTPGSESEALPSRLLPDAFVDGLDAFMQQQPLPTGMHKASVKHYAQQKEFTIRWQQRKKSSQGLVGATIQHPNLGLGSVLAETDKRIKIEFVRDGKSREFDRQIVLPLLTILSTP